jgi:hypothetical protein
MKNRIPFVVAASFSLSAFACGTDREPDAPVIATAPPPPSVDAPRAPAPPAAAPPHDEPIPLEEMRQFACDVTSVTKDTTLAPLGDSGDSLVLRPSGAPCSNQLVYVAAKSPERVLSMTPGMIILVDAKIVGKTLVLCWSNERHAQAPGGGPNDRTSLGVRIECALRDRAGTWSASAAVVVPDGDYAAWMGTIVPDASAQDRFTIRWFRDSMFQFLNLSSANRPSEDGVFDSKVTIDGITLVSSGAPARVPGNAFVATAL